jgi:hypothetical protein
MKSTLSVTVVALVLILALFGCSSSPEQTQPVKSVTQDESIDLDRVLDAWADTLERMDLDKIANATNKQLDAMAARPDTPVDENVMPVNKLDEANDRQFVGKFALALNRATLSSQPIGVIILPNGAVQGFSDVNRNKTKDGDDEGEIFLIQLDRDRGRLVASDNRNQIHRDLNYGDVPRGLFTAYLLGSMLNRQHTTGFDETEFEAIEIAPRGYYRTAKRGKPGEGRAKDGPKGAAPKGAPR